MSTTHTTLSNSPSPSFAEANAEQLVGATWALMKTVFLGIACLVISLNLFGGSLSYLSISAYLLTAAGTWLLYQQRSYVIARYFGYLGSSIACLLVVAQYGEASYSYFLLLPLALGTLSAFQSGKKRFGLSLIPLALALGCHVSSVDVTSAFITPVESPQQYRIVFILITMILCYSMTGSFMKVNRAFRSRLLGMISRLEENEEKLQLKCLKEQEQLQEFEATNRKLEIEIQNRIKVERDLSSSNEQLEQFSYAASHDLKEPLRSISSFIRLIQRKVVSLNDAAINHYTNEVIDSASRMTQLLDDLLEYSRAGKLQRTSTLVDLNQVLDSTLHGLKDSLEANSVKVEAQALPHVLANRKRLSSLFEKLILNAIQNCVKERDLVVSITTGEISDSMVEILVSDNGRGIKLADREKVFQLFYKSDNNKDAETGSGIGLSICRKIVYSFGGEIKFLPNGNRPGVTCLFTLPVLSLGES